MYKYEIRYTCDGSSPTPQSTLYTRPVVLPKEVTCISACFLTEDTISKTLSHSISLTSSEDADAGKSAAESPRTAPFSCSRCGESITPKEGKGKCSCCGTRYRYSASAKQYKLDSSSIMAAKVPVDRKSSPKSRAMVASSVPTETGRDKKRARSSSASEPMVASLTPTPAPVPSPTPEPKPEPKPELETSFSFAGNADDGYDAPRWSPSRTSPAVSDTSSHSSSYSKSSNSFWSEYEPIVWLIVMLFGFVFLLWNMYNSFFGFPLYRGIALVTGDRERMLEVGHLYDRGYAKAFFFVGAKWYSPESVECEKAENRHYFAADRDKDKAMIWYKKAADAGSVDAKYHLGILHFNKFKYKLRLAGFNSLKDVKKQKRLTPAQRNFVGEAEIELKKAEEYLRISINGEYFNMSDRTVASYYQAQCLIEMDEIAFKDEIYSLYLEVSWNWDKAKKKLPSDAYRCANEWIEKYDKEKSQRRR